MIEAARRLLRANATPYGLLGNQRAYQQVWARDSMICGLGLLTMGEEGRDLHRAALHTLKSHQSRLGRIPHNVSFGLPDPALVARGMQDLEPGEDTAHAGCIDNNLWFLMGQHFVDEPRDEQAYLWLEYQDSNECGLLEAHEAMDWADLFGNRYNTLYANALWYALNRTPELRRKLNTLLWVGPEHPNDYDYIAATRKEWLYPCRLVETLLVQRPYYLPYMGFRDYGDRFDTFGNLLAILTGLADEAQTERILDYIDRAGLADPWPIRSLDHPVRPGDKDWREYYRVRNLNQPDQYHNGGAWPFLGGFYVGTLVKAGRPQQARQQFERLTEMVSVEPAFNEWFHGRSGRPMGFGGQSWSAALYLWAHECVESGRCPGFEWT